MIFYRPKHSIIAIVNRYNEKVKIEKSKKIGLFNSLMRSVVIISTKATTCNLKQKLMSRDGFLFDINIEMKFKISDFEQIALLRTQKQRDKHYKDCVQAVLIYTNNYLSDFTKVGVFTLNNIELKEVSLISELAKLGLELMNITFSVDAHKAVRVNA